MGRFSSRSRAPILSDIFLAHRNRILAHAFSEYRVVEVAGYVDDYLVMFEPDTHISVDELKEVFSANLSQLIVTAEEPCGNMLRFLDIELEFLKQHTCWELHGFTVDCLYLDFRKAFDLVSHALLIQKLCWYNINPSVIEWIKEYLNFRRQMVVLNGMQSDQVDVTSGVSQGSVLGHFFFLST